MAPPSSSRRRPKADEAYAEASDKEGAEVVPQGPVMTCLPGERMPDYEAVKQCLAATDFEDALTANPHAQLVAPGEELMVLPPPPTSPPTQGEETEPTPTMLEAGEGVREEQARLVADRYGYVYDSGKVLQVLSPLWVSGDGMQVRFLHFRQLRTPARVDRGSLQQMLSEVGAVADPDDEAVEQLLAGLSPAETLSVLLMNGEPAQRGVDGRIDYSFDPEVRSGTLQEDGSIDLRERNSSIGVVVGEKVATIYPPTDGTGGRNVLGEDVAAEDGTASEITGGANITMASGDGGVIILTSEIAGNVHIKNGQVEVTPVFRVDGDLTYETGNVEVEGDVEVTGTVLAGFSVKAGGDITVGGTVENAVSLTARGDIIVAQGVLGEETQVAAVGNLTARYVQNAHAMVGGDIMIGNYLYNADIRCGGHVSVSDAGGGRSGTIAGGRVMATGGIDACYAGARSGDRTIIGVDGTPSDTMKAETLQAEIAELDGRVRRLLRTLGITKIDGEALARLMKAAPPRQRTSIIAFVKRLRTMLAEREKVAAEWDEVQGRINEQVKAGVLEISKEVYGGTEVFFAQRAVTISMKTPPSAYYFADEEIRSRALNQGSDESQGAEPASA
ncbi:MAG: DUF342 domain-containing protein [Gemmatimonadetes bacterium]|mgnify:CR=1 FL=1|nr:DUF342 domain-containing protein [Gemmatimonadota bacterium]MBT5058245.1 DUF342 domain-containing protein [Gemmatimonadota bacterium]MBT5142318.1 DUF342 domain-containing protein [Gemmatimonadota bacterium]MBT5589097.1 DUF342 domain-containing protein [Gemmatimonadota bacterium]MBT5960187.1 DUF342 domain-containing protein [Gemmatimonadota bacterium]